MSTAPLRNHRAAHKAPWRLIVGATAIVSAGVLAVLIVPDAPARATSSAAAGGQSFVGQDFDVYLGTGETMDASFVVAAPGQGSQPARDAWDEVRSLRVIAIDPSGQRTVKTLPFTKGDSPTDTPALSASVALDDLHGPAGVWNIRTVAIRSDGSEHPVNSMRSGSNNAIIELTSWNITPRAADGSAIAGRVWTDEYRIMQFGRTTKDVKLFHLSPSGVLYRQELDDFDGIASYTASDNLGLATGCKPTYASATIKQALTRYPTGCDNLRRNRVFFDKPDASMPATAKFYDGTTDWVQSPYQEPELGKPAYYPDGGSRQHGGTIMVPVSGQDGTLALSIDTNADGDYTDATDVTLSAPVTPGEATIDWDGKDGSGRAMSLFDPITIRAALSKIGESHFLQFDVEGRAGGVTYTQLTGPDAGSTAISWNDTPLGTGCTNGGGATVPCSGSVPSPKKADRLDSEAGVHAWGPRAVSTWGDNRVVDEWVYVEDKATSSETSVAIPKVPADLRLVETRVGQGPVMPGDTVTWMVKVGNFGPGSADQVDVTNLLPKQIDPTTAVLTDPSRGTANGLNWDVGSLAADDTATIQVSGRIAPGATGSLVSHATATSPDDATGPPADPIADCQDNTDLATDRDNCDLVEIPMGADLRVLKSGPAQESDRAGSALIWVIEVKNYGPAPATAVVVRDLLPAQIDRDRAELRSASKGTTDGLTWRVGRLAVGEAATVTVFGEPMPRATGAIVNRAIAESPDDPTGPPGDPATDCEDNTDLDSDTDNCDVAEISKVRAVAPPPVHGMLPAAGGPSIWIAAAGVAAVLSGIVVLSRRRPRYVGRRVRA